jgi:hypothetical protein
MTHTTGAGVVLLVLGQALVGCGGGDSASMPVMPTPVPQPTYSLSGVVFIETPKGRVVLQGVRVEEANSHQTAISDREGIYTLTGLHAASNSLSASRWDKVAYATTLTITGNSRLDIELPTYTLSGVAFERTPTGTAPIGDVEVYCDGCGSPYGHTAVYTDATGFYSLSYAYSGTNHLLIRKDGYGDPAGQPAGPVQGYLSRQAMVNGDTTFDIELDRR